MISNVGISLVENGHAEESQLSGRLLLHSTAPYNAEPPLSELIKHKYTPEELMYCRNHCYVPPLSEDTFTVNVDGEVQKELEFTVAELATTFPRKTVVAALQCAGNRRSTMSRVKLKNVQGILWGDGTVANARWTGVALRDILLYAGFLDDSIPSGNKSGLHVCFASYSEVCEDDDWYGASIPLEKAMDPEGDVLLAFEMNDQPLSFAHGYPLRVVIPGYCGARWVKWVQRIMLSREESHNFYQQNDYKILPPEVETREQILRTFPLVPPLQELGLNSAVTLTKPSEALIDGNNTKDNISKLHMKGYAVPSAHAPVSKVEVSADRGRSWHEAQVTCSEGRWSWVLWEACIDVDVDVVNRRGDVNDASEENAERYEKVVWCRAWDTNGEAQTRVGSTPWNLRGVAYNGYGECTW